MHVRGFYGSSLEVVLTTSAHIPLAGTQLHGHALEQGGLRNVPKKKKLFFSPFSFLPFCFCSLLLLFYGQGFEG